MIVSKKTFSSNNRIEFSKLTDSIKFPGDIKVDVDSGVTKLVVVDDEHPAAVQWRDVLNGQCGLRIGWMIQED